MRRFGSLPKWRIWTDLRFRVGCAKIRGVPLCGANGMRDWPGAGAAPVVAVHPIHGNQAHQPKPPPIPRPAVSAKGDEEGLTWDE